MRRMLFVVLWSYDIILNGHNDRIILSNGDEIVGETKDMAKGILTMETDYSDYDLKMEWEKVRGIKSLERYTIN